MICLSGCPLGKAAKIMDESRRDYTRARTLISQYLEWFGGENYYLELQQNLVYGDTQRNRRLAALAKEMQLGVGVNGGVQDYLARRSGRKPITYDHPLEKHSLDRTLGVVLFQDQVNQLAIDVAGFPPSEGDRLQRAFGRKHNKELLKQYWLKFHHPLEFFVGLFNEQPMGFYNLETLKEDAKRHGVRILNPDINKSQEKCVIEGGALRLGFLAVTGLGDATAKEIMQAGRNAGNSTASGIFWRAPA